jgi:hypothetical protein
VAWLLSLDQALDTPLSCGAMLNVSAPSRTGAVHQPRARLLGQWGKQMMVYLGGKNQARRLMLTVIGVRGNRAGDGFYHLQNRTSICTGRASKRYTALLTELGIPINHQNALMW